MSRMKWVFCCAVVAATAVAARISAEDLFGALEGPSDDAPTASGALHPEGDSEGELSVASGASTRRRENEARIEAILDQPLKTPLIFADTPLDHLIDVVSDDYDVQIVIDRAAFDALALSPEVEITVSLRNITLRSAFDLLLSATPSTEDLTFLVDDEVLLITSKDVAESRLQVRVYRVDDLIRDDVNGRLDFDSLTDLIIATVAQDSWAENGTGEGEVRSWGEQS